MQQSFPLPVTIVEPLPIQKYIDLVLQRGVFRAVLDSAVLGRCCVGGDKHCETSCGTPSGHCTLGFTWASSTWIAKDMEHSGLQPEGDHMGPPQSGRVQP